MGAMDQIGPPADWHVNRIDFRTTCNNLEDLIVASLRVLYGGD
jgi:hypothetical protein